MAINQKNIFVYDDFSAGRPILMGILYVNVIKGGEAYSFEYDRADSIRLERIFLAYLQMLLRIGGVEFL